MHLIWLFAVNKVDCKSFFQDLEWDTIHLDLEIIDRKISIYLKCRTNKISDFEECNLFSNYGGFPLNICITYTV